MRGKKLKSGFTLVELLVVMAIIGILATVSLGYFRTSQIKGRDARRKHDLGQIQKALEMYNSDHGSYWTGSLPTGQLKDSSGTVYMQKVPQDPSGMSYCYDGGGDSYQLYANLENKNDPAIPSSGCEEEDDCRCGDTDYNYKVSSPNVP